MKMKQWLCAALASFVASAGLAIAGYPQVTQVAQAPAAPAAPAAVGPAKVMPEAQPIVIAPSASYGYTDGYVSEGSGAPRVWFGADYLLWWVKDGPLPTPLVTTGDVDQGFPDAGAIGTPGTAVVLGGQDMNYDVMHGGRVTFGATLRGNVGIEGSGFVLGRGRFNEDIVSDGSTPLFTPLNVEGVGEVGVPIALPEDAFGGFLPVDLPGSAHLTSTTELWGAEVNGTYGMSDRLMLLLGFRYLNLQEDLSLTTTISSPEIAIPGPNIPPLSLITNDRFNVRNQFYGANLGAKVGFGGDRLSADVIGKVALGSMHQKISASGKLVLTVDDEPEFSFAGGRFVQGTNGGHFQKDEFCAIPEVEVRVGYRLNSWLRATIAYNFLYVSSVLRPGEQFDRNLNLSSVPIIQEIFGGAPGSPVMPLNSTDFWAQGINFGLNANW